MEFKAAISQIFSKPELIKKLGLNVSPVLAKNSCKIVKKIEKR